MQAADFWALGLEPIALSAISGSGSGDLLDRLIAAMPPPAPADAAAVRHPLACSMLTLRCYGIFRAIAVTLSAGSSRQTGSAEWLL